MVRIDEFGVQTLDMEIHKGTLVTREYQRYIYLLFPLKRTLYRYFQ